MNTFCRVEEEDPFEYSYLHGSIDIFFMEDGRKKEGKKDLRMGEYEVAGNGGMGGDRREWTTG